MKFKAKVDWWIYIVLAVVLAPIIWVCAAAVRGMWTGALSGANGAVTILLLLIGLLPLVLYIIPTLLNTYYVLDDNCLVIKSGLFKPRRISYARILDATAFRSFWISSAEVTSPVFSFDMIEIVYATPTVNGSVIIAPSNRKEFLRQLDINRQRAGGRANEV